jgi:hypothetical protein
MPLFLPLLLIGGGVGAIAAVIASGFGEGEPAPPLELPDLGTGAISTVPDAPPPVAGTALDPDEVEALARVIASEAGGGTRAEKLAIGWTERNRALALGRSLYAIFFPWREQKGANPPASSARPATDDTRSVAREVLSAPQAQDPTQGATAFFEPKLQDILFKAGALARQGQTGKRVIDGVTISNIERFTKYTKDAATVRASWGGDQTIYAVAGRFEFWGKKKPFLARGGQVKTIVVGESDHASAKPGQAFKDIPDPLALLQKLRRG